MRGKIVRVLSGDYTIKLENDKYMLCTARGVFRNKKITPLVGDNVIVDVEKSLVTEVLERKNELVRPPVSNIDKALIVVSAKEPDFNSNLLDKMLNIIEFNNIHPIICVSKYDLLNDTKEIDDIINYYKKIGYEVYLNTDLNSIMKIFKNSVVILTGQSGVGKSSLMNKLDNTLELQTGEISKALGRGKHTTRCASLYNIYYGLACDTPGFSKLDFFSMTKEDIRDNFIEFNEYKDKCKYRDCMHINEDECEIKKKVNDNTILKSRYENYLKFISEKEREK